MKSKQYNFFIKKEKFNLNDNISNILEKIGIIKKNCLGLYTYLPIGKKIIDKIIFFIKKNMNEINVIEIFTPILQHKELWEKSNRINLYKSELMTIKNRYNKEFILSPTNEEIITNIVKNISSSYKEFPIKLFQVQNKFRDEIRPKCSLIRTIEFIMKDSYSFHINKKCLNKTYNKFIVQYSNILKKLSLNYYIVKTNSNNMKENNSLEFHVQSKYGDSKIITCDKTKYSEILNKSNNIYKIYRLNPKENIKKIIFKKNKNYYYIINNFIDKNKLIKIYILYSNNNIVKNSKYISVVLRFNDKISINKLNKINKINKPIKFLNRSKIFEKFNCHPEYLNILNINIPIILDYKVALMSDFITGGNIINSFIKGINWNKDINLKEISDISENEYNINNNLKIINSLELCHIFNLDNTYTKDINFKIKLKNNNIINPLMGCYGIGISRLLFSIIENNIDKYGINFPKIISPFQIAILPINIKNNKINYFSNKIYKILLENNYDVLLENRNKNFGYLFKNIDLLGIPITLIISNKCIDNNYIEIKKRCLEKIIKIKYKFLIKYLNMYFNY